MTKPTRCCNAHITGLLQNLGPWQCLTAFFLPGKVMYWLAPTLAATLTIVMTNIMKLVAGITSFKLGYIVADQVQLGEWRLHTRPVEVVEKTYREVLNGPAISHLNIYGHVPVDLLARFEQDITSLKMSGIPVHQHKEVMNR